MRILHELAIFKAPYKLGGGKERQWLSNPSPPAIAEQEHFSPVERGPLLVMAVE